MYRWNPLGLLSICIALVVFRDPILLISRDKVVRPLERVYFSPKIWFIRLESLLSQECCPHILHNIRFEPRPEKFKVIKTLVMDWKDINLRARTGLGKGLVF